MNALYANSHAQLNYAKFPSEKIYIQYYARVQNPDTLNWPTKKNFERNKVIFTFQK